MTGAGFSMRRVAIVAEHTAWEALRQRLLVGLVALAGGVVGVADWLRDLNVATSEVRLLVDVDFGAQWVFGGVLAVAATAQLFFSELEQRSVLMVLARPVRREEFVLGKLAGVLTLLLGFCTVMTALLMALLWWRDSGWLRGGSGGLPAVSGATYAGVAWSGLVQWLRLGLLAAMTLFVASYARSQLFTVLIAFSLLVICQLQHLLRDILGPHTSPWVRGCAMVGRVVLPDLEAMNLSERLAAGEQVAPGLVATVSGYAMAFIAVFGVLAACSFRHREL